MSKKLQVRFENSKPEDSNSQISKDSNATEKASHPAQEQDRPDTVEINFHFEPKSLRNDNEL